MIVSNSEKNRALLTDLLNTASLHQIATARSCGAARRFLLEQSVDLLIVDAPLQDETGEEFSRSVAKESVAQVILIVKSEYFSETATLCESEGVLTISKPVDKAFFWSVLTLAKATYAKTKMIHTENESLKQKIEDIRIVDKAKSALISQLKMSEQDAHYFIEQQAMRRRVAKRVVAEGILKIYE